MSPFFVIQIVKKRMFARVALLSAPFATLTYSLPGAFPDSFWRAGLRVLVPVGKTLRPGFILEVLAESGLAANVKCRDLIFPLELDPLINAELASLATDLAIRQALAPGMVFGHALPAGLRKPDARIIWRRGRQKSVLSGRALAALSADDYNALVGDLFSGNAFFTRVVQDAAELEICAIAVDPPWPLRPAAVRQIGIMDFLHDNGPASRAKIASVLGPNAAAPLQKLVEAGLINIDLARDEEEKIELLPPPEPAFSLNDEQREALDELLDAMKSDKAETRLIYGVTGSGKTALYLELARACVAAGSPCLLLAPEVALAHKLYRDVAAAIPDAPHFLYHGYQHPLKREKLFRAIAARTGPYVVVGTRSALFLPVAKPGCIILDEEHDASYKQDENLPYHAKELAWHRARTSGGLLALGSATPDIRTFYAVKSGIIRQARLSKRATGGALPPIELANIDSRGACYASLPDRGLITQVCEDALTRCLKNGEQAIILLNRRGYAPLIYCISCERTISCPHCQIGMTFHKGLGKLICHYCGYSIPWPSPCPECGGSNCVPLGEGTERIAERLEALAGTPVLRLDRDSARRPGRIDEILSQFGAGKSPFLVGTQMLSKGHHFPNVTLVVVADGDIGLNLPDYRAAERTFQLLAQSAGRAGRGRKPGRALIQTRNSSHYCWRHIVNYDYEGFYEAELALRKRYIYPPFTRLALLRFSWRAGDDDSALAARELGAELKNAASGLGAIFLGPAPAPIAMINGRKRMQCLIKASDWKPARELGYLAQKHKAAKKLRIFLDLDPVNML